VRVLSAVAVLAFVSWRGAAGLLRYGAELSEGTIEEHRRALSAGAEERLRAVIGARVDIWLAVRAHVPPDRRLLISYSETARGRELFLCGRQLRALLCPSGLRGVPYDPRKEEVLRPPDTRKEYVLDLDSGRDFSAFRTCEELARGPDYRLLLIEGGTQ